MALHHLELLNMHQQAAVALEQHDLAVVFRRGDTDGERNTVADRAEVPNRVIVLRSSSAHGGMEIGLMPRSANAVVVLGDDPVEFLDRAARIEQVRLDRKLHRPPARP
jgi:hypothetical protein